MTSSQVGVQHDLPNNLGHLPWRSHPLDGKLLLFERATGLNVLLESSNISQLRRIAPRTLLIAVTNFCNLSCEFCYRNLASESKWQYQTLLRFCQEADEWGVLEVAFGGGEPMIFPDWARFIIELHASTKLGINFTTNGLLLTKDFLQTIAGHYGQIRLSLYKDNNWRDTIILLTHCKARFGVNWLITPHELKTIETKFMYLLKLGVRDFLLLSYKGNDPKLHFKDQDYCRLEEFVVQAHNKFGAGATIKLDVCWGNRLNKIPRLLTHTDCLAGDDFVSITSDKQIKPCSFHHLTIPFVSLDDVRVYWQKKRAIREAAMAGGCARLSNRGLNDKGEFQYARPNLARI